ncbi:MAG: hypothetical protein R3185_07605, partial [Candidatus Thermoplasmatota archaeon]|nr:hypothetical protein [Candidatus Thermoplasmatota archaeon]
MSPGRLPVVLLLVAALALAGCTSVVDEVSGRPSNAWALDATGFTAAREAGATGEGVRVAVVDTGIQGDHVEFENLPAQLLWGDVVNGRERPYDDSGHGTHVSG